MRTENVAPDIRARLDAIDDIRAVAEAEGRDLTKTESSKVDQLLASVRAMTDELEQPRRVVPTTIGHFPTPPRGMTASGYDSRRVVALEQFDADAPAMWRNLVTNEAVPVLSRKHRFADLYAGDPRTNDIGPNPIGRLVQAMVSGRDSGVSDIRAAMGGNSNFGGGYMVPEILSAKWIDTLRGQSVLDRAGSQTVPMESDTMTIARVATDPTIEDKAENSAFTETSITFDAVSLSTHTCGAWIVASRELAADAPNFAPMVEQVLAKKVAQQVDKWGLVGSSTFTGVTNVSGVQVTDSNVGSIAGTWYDEVIAAIADVEGVNGTPNGIITHPDTTEVYRKLKTGGGTNAAAMYSTPPPAVAALPWYSTTQATSGELYVADWSTVLIGLRQGALLEVSNDAGDAFKKHQVYVKLTVRVAFNAEHPNLIAVLRGITA